MSSLISFGWGGSEVGLQEQRVAEVGLVKVAQFRDRFEGKERHQYHDLSCNLWEQCSVTSFFFIIPTTHMNYPCQAFYFCFSWILLDPNTDLVMHLVACHQSSKTIAH